MVTKTVRVTATIECEEGFDIDRKCGIGFFNRLGEIGSVARVDGVHVAEVVDYIGTEEKKTFTYWTEVKSEDH